MLGELKSVLKANKVAFDCHFFEAVTYPYLSHVLSPPLAFLLDRLEIIRCIIVNICNNMEYLASALTPLCNFSVDLIFAAILPHITGRCSQN